MKKAVVILILAIALCFSYAFFATDNVAYAADTPVENGDYRASTNLQVYKFLDGAETPLFVIPDTYYFAIYRTSKDGLNLYINYNGSQTSDQYYVKASEYKTSYVLANDAKDVSPLGGFSVALALNGDSASFAKFDGFEFNPENLASSDTTTITFIGKESTLDTCSRAYVSVKNGDAAATYGYIAISDLKIKADNTPLASYTIDSHPNYRTVVTDDSGDAEKQPIDNAKLIRIILIVGIVVPALVILILLFKPSKKTRYDYDRNNGYNTGYSPYDRPRSRYRDDYDDGYARPRRRDDDYDDRYDDNRRY